MKMAVSLRRGGRLLAAGLCVLALAAAGYSQQNKSPEQKEAVLRTTARLVQVSAIVLDRNGAPIVDLTPDDFVISDGGQPQRIAVFHRAAAPAAATAAKAAAAGVYSNRTPQGAEAPGSATVILLDGLNTRTEDQAYAREQVMKFLETLRPPDRVALYGLGYRLHVLHDFTSDPARLRYLLARYRGHTAGLLAPSALEKESTYGSLDPDPAIQAEIEEWLRTATQRIDNMLIEQRVLTTLEALESIAHRVAAFPGRKNLVWVSSSFPFSFGMDDLPGRGQLSVERRQFFREMERASRAMSHANLAIYPLDARGLVGAFSDPNFNAPGTYRGARRTFGGGQEGPTNPVTTLGSIGEGQETMKSLADRTGGQAFLNNNDLQAAVRQVLDTSRVTYELGFYPTHNKWDGKFREIKVQVRRPGAQVQARRGYYAYADAALDAKTRKAALRAAMESPLESTALSVTAHLDPIPGAEPGTWNVRVEVVPEEMLLGREGDLWTSAVGLTLVQKLPEGRSVVSLSQVLELKFEQPTYDKMMADGLSLTKKIKLEPDAYELRVLVQDATGGQIGSVSVPLKAYLPQKSAQKN
jgi:VWFA-related protein